MSALRIGELAELAGVTTRTVRHYHRVGLLPEPEREVNGYRAYGSRDAVRLLRIRRLIELGLSLAEVADALAGDEERELREVLGELDADLARQEERIREQRRKIASLLTRASDMALSDDLARTLTDLRRVAGDHPGVERERILLELLEANAGAQSPDLFERYRQVLAQPDLVAHAMELGRRVEALADKPADDPGIEPLARETAAFLPRILDAFPDVTLTGNELIGKALLGDMSPAQIRFSELVAAYAEEVS